MAMNDVGIKITAQDATGAAFNSVGGKLGALKTQAAGIGDTVGALVGKFGALGLAISSAMSVASVKGAIDAADAFSKMAQKTGVTVEALRELNYAASLSDVSTEALGTGLKKLSQNMALAAGGSKLQGEAFKAMGLSVKDTSGSLKGADTMLTEIAAKFASFKDGPEKAAMAINLFGKAGADMIPLLNAGATGLSDMAQEARDLGTVFGGDMGKQAEAFNDNLTRIGVAATSASYAIAAELLPTLNTLAEKFLEAQKASNGFGSYIGGALKTVIEAATILYSDVEFVLKGIGREFGAIAAQMGALARGDFRGFSAISEAVKEDAKRARAELDKFQFDLLNAGLLSSKAGAGRGTAADPRVLGSTQTSAPIVAQGTAAAAAATAKTISEAAKGLALYNDLMDQGAGFEKTWAEDANKLRAALDGKTISQTQFNEAANALLQKQPVMVAAAKAQADAQKEITKELDASAAAQQKLVAASFSELDNAQAAYEAHGKLASVLQEENLARLENSRLITAMAGEDTSALDVQIANKKKVIAALQGTELKNAADDLAKANQKAAEESGQWWEDALMRAFESGKGFFQSLWDTIKNTLKTQVLKVTVQGVMGTLGIGASGAAFAGGGGTDIFGLANTASSLSSLYSAGSSIISLGSQVAAGTMGIANALGTLAANATGTGITGLLATNGAFGTAAAGTAASAAGGLTAGLAAIPGWGWAALGVAAVASIFGGGGETRSGATYDDVGGNARYQQGPSGGEIAGSEARRLFNVATDSIEAALAAVGSKAKLTGFTAGLESSEKGKGFDFAGGFIDGVGFGEYSGREGDKNGQFPLKSQSAEQAFANYATQLKQATVQALQAASDVPKTIKDMFSGVNANTLTGEAVDALLGNINTVVGMVNTFNQAVLTLPFANLKNLSFDAAAGLIAFSGGLENLSVNLGTYYTNFYSAEEQRAQTIKNINAATAGSGFDAATATRDSFRVLVEAQDLTTESGQRTYAALIGVAGAFSQVADGIAASVNTLFDTIEKRLSDLQQSIASEREAVAGARAGLLGGTPKTAAQLAAEIAGAKVAMPTDANVINALAARTAAQAGMTAAQSAQSATSSVYGTALSSAQAGLNSTVDKYKNLAAYFQDMAVSFNGYQIKVNATGTNNDAFSYNAGTNQLNPWNSTSDATQTGRAYRHFVSDTAAFTAAMTNNGTLPALQGGNAALAAAAAAVATAQAAYNTAMTAATGTLNTATAVKNAADAAAKQAVLDYAAAMTQYSGDAEQAVKVLSTLREETVAYYEAQKELAGLLIASAANLREAVRSTRFGQLDEQAGLAQQQSSFAQNYSLALSTTGVTKAGYADQLGAALPGLSTALMDASATRADWTVATASLYAQSATIAAQLEAEASAMNYEAESLALLDSIDVSLMELDTNTAILKNAIDGGASSTAAGLRAIVTQLGGVPSFDVGTNYVPRDMFARVHQGEAIVPRAFNQAAMSQGGATVEMVQELRALRTEVAGLRSEAAATAGHTSKTARLLDRAMPDGDALATRVAV